jgi:hypothetical protein
VETEHNGSASLSVVGSISPRPDKFLEYQKARVVGRTRCWVARQMARWAAREDNEGQQGTRARDSSTPDKLTSSNEVLPQPLLDCSQGKINIEKANGPATGKDRR